VVVVRDIVDKNEIQFEWVDVEFNMLLVCYIFDEVEEKH
jgi:hypothetical protein